MDEATLRCFLTLCETENTRDAAALLRVNQSNVSRALVRLEGELGAELFTRHGRRLELNRAGVAVRADAAMAAHDHIRAAVAAAQAGQLDAIVTAPIAKEAFQRAGIPEPGHTELLARLTRTRRYAMMLFGDQIRVVLATRHLPLRRVADALTADAIVEAVEMLSMALPWMGFSGARIGVCGLNPHAGDGGMLGTEEKTVIAPALARCRRRGWNVAGPIPADAIFHQHLAGIYDAVVAMYHDQGLAPMKMLSFDSGVNLTLGLPIVRTSPDHGTAFDLAGKGAANPTSTRAALDWAARLAARPNPWARIRSAPKVPSR